MSEPMYTLAEATRIFAKRECARWGHEWNAIRTFDGRTLRLACSRPCGSWAEVHNADEEAE